MTKTFEELQAQWRAMEVKPIRREDLLKMTLASHLPRLRRLRRRLFLECAFSLIFVIAVMTVLDLFSHGPLWLTLAFIACNGFYVFNNFLGYHYLNILPQGGGIRSSLIEFSARMKTMEILSSLSGAALGLITILIMNFRGGNLILWAIVLTILMTGTWLSVHNWSRRVRETADTLKGFGDYTSEN